jgi:hypothetical protein
MTDEQRISDRGWLPSARSFVSTVQTGCRYKRNRIRIYKQTTSAQESLSLKSRKDL